MIIPTVTSAVRQLSVLALVAMLSACAQPSSGVKSLYRWGAYQPSVYDFLTEDGADYHLQAETLEKNVQTAQAHNAALPPGFRAHLGMLYLKTGKADKALELFEDEKTVYPESTLFMDFLMRNQVAYGG
jgi:hypothetical protein